MAGNYSTGQPPVVLSKRRSLPKPIPAVRRGALVHVVADVAFTDFKRAVCAWSAVDAERVELKHEGQDVPSRRCDDCALDLTRDVLRALGTCPRWGKQRHGVESRCPNFVAKAKEGTR